MVQHPLNSLPMLGVLLPQGDPDGEWTLTDERISIIRSLSWKEGQRLEVRPQYSNICMRQLHGSPLHVNSLDFVEVFERLFQWRTRTLTTHVIESLEYAGGCQG